MLVAPLMQRAVHNLQAASGSRRSGGLRLYPDFLDHAGTSGGQPVRALGTGDRIQSTGMATSAPVRSGAIAPTWGAGAIDRVTLLMGSKAILGGFEGIAKQAKQDLVAEFFIMNRPDVIKALRHAAKDGLRTEVLADAEMMDLGWFPKRAWKQKGLELIAFPEKPRKLHSKALAGDSRALVATGYATNEKRQKYIDFGVAFEGPAARALEGVMRANRSGETRLVQQAAIEARKHGVLMNDRNHGVRLLTTELESMIAGAKREILIGTKDLSDDRIFNLLYDARQRGVTVRVVTGRESPFAINRGMDIRRYPFLHGNVMIVDGKTAYVGSAFFHTRPMARYVDAIMSNETGVLIQDTKAIQTLVKTLTTLANAPHP